MSDDPSATVKGNKMLCSFFIDMDFIFFWKTRRRVDDSCNRFMFALAVISDGWLTPVVKAAVGGSGLVGEVDQ